MTGPAQPPAGTPTPEKQALLEAFDEVLKAEAETRDQAPGRAPSRPWPVHPVVVLALLVLAGTGTYIGVVRPPWLFQRGMPPESASIQDASLRMGMAVQYQRIERFRQANGRLPESLAQVGEPMQGISYERLGTDQFVLRGRNGGVSLELHSTDAVREFVANSYMVIQRRGQR
jgi:hypothetical protein